MVILLIQYLHDDLVVVVDHYFVSLMIKILVVAVIVAVVVVQQLFYRHQFLLLCLLSVVVTFSFVDEAFTSLLALIGSFFCSSSTSSISEIRDDKCENVVLSV